MAREEVPQPAKPKPDDMREWAKENSLINSALIGVGVVMIQPFLTASSLDLSATICVVAFALAIPVLAVLFLLGLEETYRQRMVMSGIAVHAKGVFRGLAVVGVVAGFWHIHWTAGAAMLVGGVAAAIIYGLGLARLDEETAEAPGFEPGMGG